MARLAPAPTTPARRVSAVASAGALTAVLATVIAVVAAVSLGGIWLLLVRLAG